MHVDRLVFRVRAILGRADVDAQVAAGAVFRSYLDGEGLALEFEALVGGRFERGGRAGEVGRVIDLGADRRMRTDEDALVALDADLGVPDRDLDGDVPLLPF